MYNLDLTINNERWTVDVHNTVSRPTPQAGVWEADNEQKILTVFNVAEDPIRAQEDIDHAKEQGYRMYHKE